MSKWDWFKDKMVDAVLVVIFAGITVLIANGVLQSSKIDTTLEKVANDLRTRFEKDIADVERQAINREAELLAKAEQSRKEVAQALIEIRELRKNPVIPTVPFPSLPMIPPAPDKSDWDKIEVQSKADPEKAKLEYLHKGQHDIDVRQSAK